MEGEGEDEGVGRGEGLAAAPLGVPRRLWWIGSVALVAIAAVVAVYRRQDLAAASHLIAAVRPPRLVLAAGFEAASLAALVALQQWLLRTGGARLRLRVVAAVVPAANAVAGAVPGGAAVATAWVFAQWRRRGVGQVLAGAVLAVSGVLSAVALLVLLVAGALAGGSAGPGALRPVVLGTAAFLAVAAGAAAGVSRFRPVRRLFRRLLRRLGARSRRLRDVEDGLRALVRHVRAVRPGLRPWWLPFTFALLNWVCDAACLLACAWALGIAVPWRGILVVYALTQMTGSLRLTPGGLGVVEAGLTALLVLYGLPADRAIALTLLYRIVGYWALQPLGWACWLGLTLGARRADRRAEAGGRTG
ncbi:flippase-like domain-containing protein [Streptacidiphilus sp. ASG 303]|uniref:lysylphosphatidylglycerol synthase transmembrane domain-containing protein n=1 Tax=Streptacidiphilus sp. ASG 303 TaxID=2896847 RepID=UPI001E53C8D2|nr:flippase-like domain-containing protein [Streptacidiphilus sp. ASG 303]MCD0484150.1 flippase-like domain-containing protein [Streptacidiphilus sp. ASG 303]